MSRLRRAPCPYGQCEISARFVALEASFDVGEILTKPLELKSAAIHLDAKSDFGGIVVEALDRTSPPHGADVPGSEASPCRLITDAEVEGLIGHAVLGPGVLDLERPETLRLLDVQAAALNTPTSERLLGDACAAPTRRN